MSLEKKKSQFAEDMLVLTGPIVALNDFKNYSALPAPQTMRNRLAEGKIPREWFFKRGRMTLVDMKGFLPYWAENLTSYAPTGQIGRK
ncbi:MAG: hypothetical protein KJ658_05175 [Proteobacteria bacterium]|nr:hypothetical protein [Desulfobacula sp.]MBU3951510.1 hypothetical protein [Pseudomonadota bacterium]